MHATGNKRTARLYIVASLVVVATATAAKSQEPTVQQPVAAPRTPTSEIRAILRIVCAADSGLANATLIDTVIHHDYIEERARALFVKTANQEELPAAESAGPLIEITVDPSRFTNLPPGVYMGDIAIKSFDQRVPAIKYLTVLREGLTNRLFEMEGGLHEAEKSLREREQQLAELERMEQHYAQQVRIHGGKTSPQIVEQRLIRIDEQKLEAELKINGLAVTINELQRRIAELGPRIAAATKQDAVLIELEQLVPLRTRQRELMAELVAKQKVPAADLLAADNDLAVARAEYAKQLRLAAQEAGSLRLKELEQRLEDSMMEAEEVRVRLKTLDQQQRLADQEMAIPVELAREKATLDEVTSLYARTVGKLQEDRMQLRFRHGPSVTIVLDQDRLHGPSHDAKPEPKK